MVIKAKKLYKEDLYKAMENVKPIGDKNDK